MKNIKEDLKIFGFTVRGRRKELHISQKELAKQVGMSERHISDIENGYSNPKIDTVVRLCIACKISMDAIFLSKTTDT